MAKTNAQDNAAHSTSGSLPSALPCGLSPAARHPRVIRGNPFSSVAKTTCGALAPPACLGKFIQEPADDGVPHKPVFFAACASRLQAAKVRSRFSNTARSPNMARRGSALLINPSVILRTFGPDSPAMPQPQPAGSLPTVTHMIAKLDRFVRSQVRAWRDIATAVYNHYLLQAERKHGGADPGRHHILLLGPTGSGKTYIVRTLAKFLGVPVGLVSANSLMLETGQLKKSLMTLNASK